MSAAAILNKAATEAQVQSCVTDALDTFGWLWHHESDSRRSSAGFPDLVAVHPRAGVVLFIECKRENGKLRPEQQTWALAFDACPPSRIRYLLARPSSLSDVLDAIELGPKACNGL